MMQDPVQKARELLESPFCSREGAMLRIAFIYKLTFAEARKIVRKAAK